MSVSVKLAPKPKPVVVSSTNSSVNTTAPSAYSSVLPTRNPSPPKVQEVVKTPLMLKKEALINKALDRMVLLYDYPLTNWNRGFFKLKWNSKQEYDFIFDPMYTNLSDKEASLFMERLSDEFTKIQQEEAYLQVIENAQKKGLSLQEEYIDENDTIILSYEVK